MQIMKNSYISDLILSPLSLLLSPVLLSLYQRMDCSLLHWPPINAPPLSEYAQKLLLYSRQFDRLEILAQSLIGLVICIYLTAY
jgi:hypothetical protein